MIYYDKEELKGSITLEVALVMPIIIMLVVSVIKFGYGLHDSVIISALDKYETVKARMIDWSYYNVEKQSIDIVKLANKPLVDISGEYKSNQYELLDKLISEYEEKLILNGNYVQSENNYRNGIKNSTIVRTIHILLEHAGRIKYD